MNNGPMEQCFLDDKETLLCSKELTYKRTK